MTSEISIPTTTASKAHSSSQLTFVLALITSAQFMIVVDFTIVQVALPSIGREFAVSLNGLRDTANFFLRAL
jgi:hypothetical protein